MVEVEQNITMVILSLQHDTYVHVDVEDNVDDDEDLSVESKLGKQSRLWWV